ncbi:hypothetical protein DBR17_15075 [Sphingomonas sp. HMWF008]|nr:hypothetical protein DBR17_15075 [Sphingomonas sp. HMWF008]
MRNDRNTPICCDAAIGMVPTRKVIVMRSVLKSGFLWQFFGGFALGALALVTFHPADSTRATATSSVAANR